MKTRTLLLTTAAALLLGALAFAGTESEKKSPETELDRLRAKISVLEARVKSLEQRLEKSSPPTVDVPRIGPGIQLQPREDSSSPSADRRLRPFVPLPDDNARRPKIWGEGEINGWKYYLIPCSGDSAASTGNGTLKVAAPK